MKSLALGVIVSAGLMAASMVSASAALVPTSPSCGGSVSSMFSPVPLNCVGSYAGNDLDQLADVIPTIGAAFVGDTGLGNWTYQETVFWNTSGSIIDMHSGSGAGTIDFVAGITGPFAIGMNGGGSADQFSVYLFEGTSPITSIDYTTLGVFVDGAGRIRDLRSASFYSFADNSGGGTGIVPIPASGVLLGFAMLGAGYIARRGRKQ